MNNLRLCSSPFELGDPSAGYRRWSRVKFMVFHIESLFDFGSVSPSRCDLGNECESIDTFVSKRVFLRPGAKELLTRAKIMGRGMILASRETYTTPLLNLFGLREFFDKQIVCSRKGIGNALAEAYGIHRSEILLFDGPCGRAFGGLRINVINPEQAWQDCVLGNFVFPNDF